MKNSLILVLIAIILIAGGAWYSKSRQTKQSNQTQTTSSTTSNEVSDASVDIRNFSFSPQTLTVKADQMIVFTNNDGTDHTVTNETGATTFDFDINAGESANLKISTPGTYNYHCRIHPEMTGTIIVQ